MEPCFGTLHSMGTLPPESDASAGRCQPKIGRGFHDAVTFRRVGLIASSSPLGTNTNAVQHLYVLCEEESRVVVLGDELNVEGLKRGGRGGEMRQLGRRPRVAAHDTQYSGVFEARVLLLATCPHMWTQGRSRVRYADYPDLGRRLCAVLIGRTLRGTASESLPR